MTTEGGLFQCVFIFSVYQYDLTNFLIDSFDLVWLYAYAMLLSWFWVRHWLLVGFGV